MTKSEAFKILGLGNRASAEEVKSAYRRKAMQSHPDRVGVGAPDDEFKQVKLAYETLCRADFDDNSRDAFGGFDASDIFSDVFGSIFGGIAAEKVSISVSQAIHGARVALSSKSFGANGLMVDLPKGVENGAAFNVSHAGKRHRLVIEILTPIGWQVEGRRFFRTVKLSTLDQILGAKVKIKFDDFVEAEVELPVSLVEGQMIELSLPVIEPYRLVLRLDFTGRMLLNDNERHQLSGIRENLKKEGRHD